MSTIPQTPARFAKWLKKQPAMPVELRRRAEFCKRDIEMLALNRANRDLRAIRKLIQPGIDKFIADYTAWKNRVERL